MIAVVQRVTEASVSIDNKITARIGPGFLVLLGIHQADDVSEVQWLASKIAGLRVFSDHEGKMNLALKEINGEVLVVSQFTLHASTKKGNRPSFIDAARPETAIPLYENFIGQVTVLLDKPIATGQFGADMKIAMVNDGPVTIIIDSKNRI